MRKYKFLGTDGNGGLIEGVTKEKYSSMINALKEEIYKSVHRCIKCEVVS